MKKLLNISIVLLLIAAFVAVPSLATAQPPVPELTAEQIEKIKANAVEILATALPETCILPTPTVDGQPRDMLPEDDFTQAQLCLTSKGFRAQAFSDWPGSPLTIHPNQEHLVEWILLKGNTTLLAKNEIKINNPKVDGVPVTTFSWAGHCGPQQDYYIAVKRQHAWQIGLENLVERDYSWHITLPAVPCRLFLPLVSGPPLPPPPPLTCPDWTLSLTASGKTTVLHYTKDGGTGPLINLTVGTVLSGVIRNQNGAVSPLDSTGDTDFWLDGVYYLRLGQVSSFSLVGGVDLPAYDTTLLTSKFFLSDGTKCHCYISVYDP